MAKYTKQSDTFSRIARPTSMDSDRKISRERIAGDLEAFEKAGGKIERLGTTFFWKSAALKKDP